VLRKIHNYCIAHFRR